jgi:hypothetical protein
MATHLPIEEHVAELLRKAYPKASFTRGSRLDILRQLLMYELQHPNIVPETVFKAARAALGPPHKKVGVGLLRSSLRAVIRGERVDPGWRERWPDLAKMSEDDYIADAAKRLMMPEETVRNYLYGKRGPIKKRAR